MQPSNLTQLQTGELHPLSPEWETAKSSSENQARDTVRSSVEKRAESAAEHALNAQKRPQPSAYSFPSTLLIKNRLYHIFFSSADYDHLILKLTKEELQSLLKEGSSEENAELLRYMRIYPCASINTINKIFTLSKEEIQLLIDQDKENVITETFIKCNPKRFWTILLEKGFHPNEIGQMLLQRNSKGHTLIKRLFENVNQLESEKINLLEQIEQTIETSHGDVGNELLIEYLLNIKTFIPFNLLCKVPIPKIDDSRFIEAILTGIFRKLHEDETKLCPTIFILFVLYEKNEKIRTAILKNFLIFAETKNVYQLVETIFSTKPKIKWFFEHYLFIELNNFKYGSYNINVYIDYICSKFNTDVNKEIDESTIDKFRAFLASTAAKFITDTNKLTIFISLFNRIKQEKLHKSFIIPILELIREVNSLDLDTLNLWNEVYDKLNNNDEGKKMMDRMNLSYRSKDGSSLLSLLPRDIVESIRKFVSPNELSRNDCSREEALKRCISKKPIPWFEKTIELGTLLKEDGILLQDPKIILKCKTHDFAKTFSEIKFIMKIKITKVEINKDEVTLTFDTHEKSLLDLFEPYYWS